jgi:polyribonucleotide nucleotidyltransferase
MIASPDGASINAAIQWIKSIVAEPEVGKIYDNAGRQRAGLRRLRTDHAGQRRPGPRQRISEERSNKTSDVVKEGDKVTVKLVAIDDRGRLQLSMKAAEQFESFHKQMETFMSEKVEING